MKDFSYTEIYQKERRKERKTEKKKKKNVPLPRANYCFPSSHFIYVSLEEQAHEVKPESGNDDSVRLPPLSLSSLSHTRSSMLERLNLHKMRPSSPGKPACSILSLRSFF